MEQDNLRKVYMHGEDKDEDNQPPPREEPDHRDYERKDNNREPLVESEPPPDQIEPETDWDRE